MKNKKKKGFTLIELIAVIAILGILAAVLVPNIIGYTNKSKISKVKADAKVVLNVIQAAKADSDTPGSITNYTTAIAADSSLTLTTTVDPQLEAADVTTLSGIISNTSTTFSDYSIYYTK